MAQHGADHVPTNEELRELAEILDRTLHPIQLVQFFSKLLDMPPKEVYLLLVGINNVPEEDRAQD